MASFYLCSPLCGKPMQMSSMASILPKPIPAGMAGMQVSSYRNSRILVLKAEGEETSADVRKIDSSELRSQFSTAEAIDEEVERLRRELFTMRIKFAKREEYKPAQKKALRKRVAQLLTIKREKEIEAGIDRRTAKQMEKRRLVEAGLGRF